MAAWLAERLPPSEAGFAEIARAFVAAPSAADRSRFLLTLNGLKKDVEVPDPFGGGFSTQRAGFQKLAETLLLFEQALQGVTAAPQEQQTQMLRRAYQHYIINTDGPITLREETPAFDVFAWATEYAAWFDIQLQQAARDDGALETSMTIDDPRQRVRCAAWGAEEGRSSAWSLREVGHLINYRRYGRYDVVPSRLFAFEPRARGHSKANALALAELSQLVYLQPGYVRTQLGQRGYEEVRWIEDRRTDTQAVLAGCDDHAVLVFRGTAGGRDILTDLLFRKVPFAIAATRDDKAPAAGEVHRGFAAALESVWPEVLAAVREIAPAKPLFVAGHSLGAALAQLAALRIAGHGEAVAGVYVYGSPRVGDADFRASYDAALRGQTFLHVNHEDAVTAVPPRWVGFDHVAQPLRRFDKGHRIAMEESESGSSTAAPEDAAADEAARRELMERAAAAVQDGRAHLDVRDLSAGTTSGMTYGATFEQGRLDDHGVAQYLFKFACSIIEDRMAAVTESARRAG
jgi:hypothetical protein